MTATNNLPLTSLAESVIVNNGGSTRRMMIDKLAELLGNGGSGPGSSLAAEVAARIAGDAQVMTNGGRFFTARANAIAVGQAAIPAHVELVFTREGTALVVRGPGQTADDPLFGSYPSWGVIARIDPAIAMRDAGIMTLTNVAGTGDVITAELPAAAKQNGVTTTSASSIVEIVPSAPNSGLTGPTLSIDGGAGAVIRSATGEVLKAGQLAGGRSYLLKRSGTTWRIINGVAQADLLAARADLITADVLMGVPVLEDIGGTENAITGTLAAVLSNVGVVATSLQRIRFKVAAANTGAVTIAINGNAAVSLRDAAGVVLAPGALVAGRWYEAIKEGTVWRLISGDVTRADLTATVGAAVAAEAAARTAADAALREEMRQRTIAMAQAVLRSGGMTAALRDQLLNDAADVRLYPGAPATITEGKVTAMTATGRLGLPFTAANSPNIDLLPDGIRVTGGYLQWVGTQAPNYSGALILLDVTRTGAPTAGAGNIVSLDLDVGTQAHLRYTTTGLNVLGPDGAVAHYALIGGYGVRQQVAALIDYVGRSMTLVSADGVAQTFALTGAANPLALNLMRFAASSLVTIHDATVLLTETGVPDLALWRQVFKQVDATASAALPYENVDCDGQSNPLMNDNSPAGRAHLAYMARDRVYMVDGMRAVGGTAVPIHGTGTARIDTTVPATALVPASAVGNPTMGFAMAVALSLHRKRMGLPEKRLLTGFSGIAGQAAVEFDNDPATGTLGTTIHDNWWWRLSERKRLAGAVPVEPGIYTICQGEADRMRPAGAWFDAASKWLQDRNALYLDLFGAFPRLGIFQSAGWPNSSADAWHCKVDQLDIVDLYGGILLCPMHAFATISDGHFTWQNSYRMSDTAAWALAELEAGRSWPTLRPKAQVSGNVVTLTYPLRQDEQLRRITGRYAEAEPHLGYEVEGATITGVQQIGARVHQLTCSAPPTAVKYALQQRDRSTPENGQYWSAHRGEVATTLTAPSTMFAGEILTRDVPGWRIAL